MILEYFSNAKRKTETEYSSPCPSCGGNDRFIIKIKENRFWCRGCGVSGDEIQFLRDFYNMSFQEAARAAKQEYKIGIKSGDRQKPIHRNAWQPRIQEIPTQIWQRTALNLLLDSQDCLAETPSAQRFLQEERGLTETTIRYNKLGWIPQPFYLPRELFGLDEVLNEQGNPKQVWIPEGLVIPQFYGDQLSGIRFRKKAGGYISLAASKVYPSFYGNPDSKLLVIVESALDAMLLTQETECSAVALHSCSTRPNSRMREWLKQAEMILLTLDMDKAGVQARNWWKKHLPQVKVYVLPQGYGKDITEAFLNGLPLQMWLDLRHRCFDLTPSKQAA